MKKVILYEYMLEKMETFADVDKDKISNKKAKYILAYCFKVPSWLQAPVIHEMVDLGLLSRLSRMEYKIVSKNKKVLD